MKFPSPPPGQYEWHPRRPDPEHRKCSSCRRTFYAGSVPAPFDDGRLICRDCRHKIYANS